MKTTNKVQELEKEKKTILGKDIVKNNPIFANEHILEFFDFFKLFADPRSNKIFIKDILGTARTLQIDQKYRYVFKILEEFNEDLKGESVDFETFIRELTERLGNTFSEEGRKKMFEIIDSNNDGLLTVDELKEASDQGRFNLNDEEIKEVITRVAGPDSKNIPYDKYERYLAKKVEQRKNL